LTSARRILALASVACGGWSGKKVRRDQHTRAPSALRFPISQSSRVTPQPAAHLTSCSDLTISVSRSRGAAPPQPPSPRETGSTLNVSARSCNAAHGEKS
jgi:hypothetical protein